MAKPSAKLSDALEPLWSAILVVCMGLAVAHIVSSSRAVSSPGENAIEQTFTADQTSK